MWANRSLGRPKASLSARPNDHRQVKILSHRDAEIRGVLNVGERFFSRLPITPATGNRGDLGDPYAVFVLNQTNNELHLNLKRWWAVQDLNL